MFQASLRVVVANNQRQQFLSILNPLLEPTSVEIGCIRCALWMSTLDERCLLFTTEWQTSKDLDRHLKSERFRAVLIATEFSLEVPNVEIRTFSETRGLDYIEELLGPESGTHSNLKNPIREAPQRAGRRSK